MTTATRSRPHLTTPNLVFTAIALMSLALGTILSPGGRASADDQTITGITPSSGLQGGEYDVTITGTGFTADIESGYVWLWCDDDEDYWWYVTGVTYVDQNTLTGHMHVVPQEEDPPAPPGAYYVEIQSDSFYACSDDTIFTVVGPTITGITPSSGHQGGEYDVTITGTLFNEDIESGEVYLYWDDDEDYWWYVTDVVYVNPTTLTGHMHVVPEEKDPPTPPGSYYIGIEAGEFSAYSDDTLFTVLGPYIDDFDPQYAKQGQTLSVVIYGQGFTGATTVIFSGTGITVTGFDVDSDTQITAAVTVAEDAALVDRSITVTTPDGTSAPAGGFSIIPKSSCGWVTMDVGPHANLASIALGPDGFPHIAYITGGPDDDLMYVSYNGSGWGTPVTVDTGSCSYPTLTFDSSGNPAISYRENLLYQLKYAWRTGGSWNNVMVWQSTGDNAFINPYGDSNSLAMDRSGNPHISFHQYLSDWHAPAWYGGYLWYATCTGDPSTPGNWTVIKVPYGANPDPDPKLQGGMGSRIALDSSDNPHICYTGPRTGERWPLYYTYKSGGSWTTPDEVTAAGVTVNTQHNSLALDSSNNPHTAIASSPNVLSATKTGGAWNIQTMPFSSWADISLALDNAGLPYFCYYNSDPNSIGYYDGSMPGTQVVDGGVSGEIVSLALDRTTNTPHVAYLDRYTNSLKYAYYMHPTTPTVTVISPDNGATGTSLDVTVTGNNFTSLSRLAFSGSGIMVNSYTLDSATQLRASITISGTADAGSRDVTISNCGETDTLEDGFTVSGATAPTVTAVTPSTGINTGSVNVTDLAGTNFVDGATVKLTRSGQADISGTSVTFVSSTKLTCAFNITGAAAGTWNVVVTNPDEQSGTLTNGFTVTAPAAAPTVASVTPNSGTQGQTLTVTITGANFTGATAVSFGASVTVNSITVNSPTQITVTITIATDAVLGTRTVSVTTQGGTGTLANGFTIEQGNYLIGTGSASGSGTYGSGTTNNPSFTPPAPLPNIGNTSASISVAAVATGEMVEVSTVVTNKGNAPGTSVVRLYLNDRETDWQSVTLAPGQSRVIKFSIPASDSPGQYDVTVNNIKAGSFIVKDNGISDAIFWTSSIMVIAALVMGVIYVWRKREGYYD